MKKVKQMILLVLGSLALFFCLLTGNVCAEPSADTLKPSYGSSLPGVRVNFTAAYSDSQGYSNLSQVFFLLNTTANPAGGFCARYDLPGNKLYLMDDSGSNWLGGYKPGEDKTIENSYAILHCASTQASGSLESLTVAWSVTFKGASKIQLSQVKNSYLRAVNLSGQDTGWRPKGTWMAGRNYPPITGALSPSQGASQPNSEVKFTAVYLDPNGFRDIKQAFLLINASVSEANAVSVAYDQNTNKLYLKDDSGANWLGGYAPGSNNIIENSFCRLNCASSKAGFSLNMLAVSFNLSFKSAFSSEQTKNTYLAVSDDSGVSTGWVAKGTWKVKDTLPPAGSVTINNADEYTNSGSVTLTLSAQDSGSGMEEGSQMCFSNDGVNFSAPEDYAAVKSWRLAPEDGLKTVNVKFKDSAGNWSSPVSDAIKLDTIPPAIIIASPSEGAVLEETPVTLRGTVDGVQFSEIRGLNLGLNTLTKTAADTAGNSGSASVSVYLYYGESIGPQGGEAVSADGKVRVIIPAGALTQTQQIKIINIKTESLQGSLPTGTSLLSVVECKPYGLVFAQPVRIIYTLYQAETPGTPVELGLYDKAQNRIIPTGQTSTIPVDGYTVEFTLAHFSTYAAIKNLTPQNIPIGLGVKIPLPDLLTGAFGHAIPITVPPGRKGLQPSLGLNYHSSSPNSWVGLGFSLNPGYIVRSTRLGPPKYIDTQDTFYLITDAGTTELVHLVDNLYQAKVESAFTKFFKEANDSWKAVGKDGSILYLGGTDSARETSPSGTFSWQLTRAQDPNTNYIDYTYTKDQGKCYLYQIFYTGNLSASYNPRCKVEFSLESRQDIISSYISTGKITTAKRLKNIIAYIDEGAGFTPVWRYELGYQYSTDTNRSLLVSMKQISGIDGKVLPEQRLGYQKAK